MKLWSSTANGLKDLIEGVTLCDSLSNIDYVMSMLLPSDVDEAIADRYQMEAMLNHATRPIIFVTYEFGGCIDNLFFSALFFHYFRPNTLLSKVTPFNASQIKLWICNPFLAVFTPSSGIILKELD